MPARRSRGPKACARRRLQASLPMRRANRVPPLISWRRACFTRAASGTEQTCVRLPPRTVHLCTMIDCLVDAWPPTTSAGSDFIAREKYGGDLFAFWRLDRLGLTGAWLGLRACLRRGFSLRGAGAEILRDRGLNQGLERLGIERVSLADVDGATRVPIETGGE